MINDAVNVDTQGTFVAAVEDAMARAASVFSVGQKTLVESISKDEWEAWDASDERPNVSDGSLGDSDDEFDDAELTAA